MNLFGISRWVGAWEDQNGPGGLHRSIGFPLMEGGTWLKQMLFKQ